MKKIIQKYNHTSLILRIFIGMCVGIVLAAVFGNKLPWISMIGTLFVSALKAIAPVLVFVLVSAALAKGSKKLDGRFGTLIFLYMLTTFVAAVAAVIASYLFPQTLILNHAGKGTPPQGIGEVLENLLLSMVANPIDAIRKANYIGVLLWAVLFGFAMKSAAKDSTKQMLSDIADGVQTVVRWIINLAPFGIMGLVYNSISTGGFKTLASYGSLLCLLVGTMLVVSLVIDPFIAALWLHRNPYPLVFKCPKESGLTAFFTRSSAANIPVNMELCKSMGLDEEFYSVAIPLGSTINMDGAAVTITIMTMAAAHTLGISVDIPSAIIMSVLATIAACGASGVAGGSLLLIPLSCSLFGISNDIAMQVVGVGFIVGIVQDSVETCLNSSGDAVFTATAEFHEWIKQGKRLPDFMYSKKELAQMKKEDSQKAKQNV